MKFQNKLSIIFLPAFIFLFHSAAQTQTDAGPCSSPESSQFNFWVGTWEANWVNQDGKNERGSNVISKILGGCVIEENFSTEDNSFTGKSISVYNTRKNSWQQTWADNTGAYLDFTGGMENGKMILSRNAVTKEGKEILQRMVWYDITENEFNWNWESSGDNGTSWQTLWKIHYVRKN